MGTAEVSCESVRGLGSWLLVYLAIVTLVFSVLIFIYPPSFQAPDAYITFPIFFVVLPLVLFFAHRSYVNNTIAGRTETLQRVRTLLVRIEVSSIKENGAHLNLTEEEFVNHFHRDCAPYVRYVLHERKE